MQEIEFELEMAGYRAGYKINHPDQVLSIKPDLPGESGVELRWTFIGNTWSFYHGPHLLYMVEVYENSVQVEYKLSSKSGQRIARLKERADDFTPFDLVVREFIAERDKT